MKNAKEILHAYLQVTRSMSRRFRHYFGQVNLTFPQAMVITALREDGEMPISKLADYTGSANSTVSGIVDRLEKLELVKRKRSDEDRRVIYVALTEKYHAELRKLQPDMDECIADVLEGLSEEELEEIAGAMEKLSKMLEMSDDKK